MKKCYLIFAVILCLGILSGCNVNEDKNISNTTQEPINTNSPNVEVPLPTFEEYAKYLEYIQSQKLPENFVYADEFFNIGKFKSAIFLCNPDMGYMYTYIDADGNEIMITIECLPSNTIKNTKQYLINKYEKNPIKNQVFYDYDSNLFDTKNLLKCKCSQAPVVNVSVGNVVYNYILGDLNSIDFRRDDLMYTITWHNNNDDGQNDRDGGFSC